MPLPFPLAVCLAGVFCSSLLALHLLWVATLHRRPRPAAVSGERDFAATLAGLTGFLLVGIAVLASAGEAWFVSRPAGSIDDTWTMVTHKPTARLATLGCCGAVLALVVGFGFWRRRDSLEIHNVVPAAVPAVADAAAAAVGLDASRGISWTLRPEAGHATVRIRGLDRPATDELLTALSTRFEAAPVPVHSAGGRYTVVAAGLLGITLALFVAYFRIARVF